jgi:hypothetical protein
MPAETGIFRKGDVVAAVTAKGLKPSKALVRIDELMPLLTREELEKLRLDLILDEIHRKGPREALAGMDTCPFCERFMGHNNPPADDRSYRRQTSFDFKR